MQTTTATRKPTQPQLTLLLRAIANGGYLTANYHTGTSRRVMLRCIANGWMREDGRIITAGRTAVLTADSLAYQAAVAEEDARERRYPRPAAQRFGQVPAAQIPDEMISYDVPAGRKVQDFVGYHIWVGDRLEMLAHVEVVYASQLDDRARLYIADDYGQLRCVGTVYVEVVCFGPPGGPDLRDQAAKLIADRKAHAAANPAMPAETATRTADPVEVTVITDEAAPLTGQSALTAGETEQLVQHAADLVGERRAALDAAMNGGRPVGGPELDLPAPDDLTATSAGARLVESFDRVRRAIVGALGAHADDRPSLRPHIDALAGETTAAGYRRKVREARHAGVPTESIRRALFQLDYALGLMHCGRTGEAATACAVSEACLSDLSE